MLNIEHLHKQYGPQKILEDAELFIGWGDRAGLVGPNGTGKTTLFRLITGQEEPDAGKVRFDDHISCDMLSQESQCQLGVTVREEMLSAFREANAAQDDIDKLAGQLEAGYDPNSFEAREALRKMSAAQTELEMQDTHTMEARIGRVLKGLGFGDDALDRLTDSFSGGWQMRIAMAKLLLREPDLLLLDEPTNHLDDKARKWLQDYLETYPGAVFVISHEPKFLNAVCTSIVELDNFKTREYTGNFDKYEEVKQQEREQQIAAYERQQIELERQQEFIQRFGAKNTKATQVKSREKMLAKMDIIEAPRTEKRTMMLTFPESVKSSLDVLRLKDVSKAYDDNTVIKNANLRINRGDRVAFIGPNGAGKSTLLRVLAGAEELTSGIREEGRNVLIGYFAQHQAEALDLDRSVLEEVLEGLELQPESVARGYLGRLGIRGEDVFKPVRVLSGGERSRVALAKFLMRPANTLLLDEPTNHLDPMARQVLQEALEAFEGTVVLVSHDTPFVHAVAKEAFRVEAGELIEQREPLVAPGANKKNKQKKK
jgi:ATP-binding cassette subfamily F protein 3